MKNSIIHNLSEMVKKYPHEETGVFVLSPKNMKQFRKAIGNFKGVFQGHQVRQINHAPDDKIYLLSKEDFAEIKAKIETREIVLPTKNSSQNYDS